MVQPRAPKLQFVEAFERNRRFLWGRIVLHTEPVYWELHGTEYSAKIMVGMFSAVSGTNHLITGIAFAFNKIPFVGSTQTLRNLFYGKSRVGPNVLRSLDWGISAPLMMVVNLLLYRIPADLVALFGYALFTSLIVFPGLHI